MANIQGLEFFQYTRKVASRGTRQDVLISKWGNNKDIKYSPRLAITFYNGIEELLLDEEHTQLTIATWKNRMYIVPTNNGKFLCDGNKANGSKHITFAVDKDNETIFDWCGDYDLKYDKARELYYVERGTSE